MNVNTTFSLKHSILIIIEGISIYSTSVHATQVAERLGVHVYIVRSDVIFGRPLFIVIITLPRIRHVRCQPVGYVRLSWLHTRRKYVLANSFSILSL